jgi:hypothetical protein
MSGNTIDGGEGRLQELTPDVIRALNQLRKATYAEGVLPQWKRSNKTRETA